MNTKPVGNYGEDIAAKYLSKEHYAILERQYRCKTGEIDIIAEKDCTMIFIEVKTRKTTKYGMAALAVTKQKQDKIKRTAMWYVYTKCQSQTRFRFDVIEVYIFSDGSNHIQHHINAFEM